MDKDILIDRLIITILSTDIKNVETLRQNLLSAMSEFNVAKLETTFPTTARGEATKQLFKLFSQSKYNQGMTEKSLKQYWMAVRDLCQFTQKEINIITYQDVNNYLTYYRHTGVALRTVKNRRLLLSSVFSYLYKNHYISDNPMDRVDAIKSESKVKIPLTKKEVECLMLACENQSDECAGIRNKAMIQFFLDTGVRASELCSIKIKDINFDDRTLIVKGKGNKYREIYFSESTLVRLKEYFKIRKDYNDGCIDSNAPLFVSLHAGKGITVGGVEYILESLREPSGISRLHPHLLRATCFSNLAERGVPMPIIQQIAGHSSIETTNIYVQLSNKTKKRYMEMAS